MLEELGLVSVGVFLVLTLIIAGSASFMTGQAVASTWRPRWQCVVYGAMLAATDRFLDYALHDGPLLSGSGFLISAVLQIAIALAAFQLTRARRMVAQYPWLFESTGPFSWRERR